MFVIIGSTLSSRLIVAHLNVSDRMEWTASFSGELELPPTHVCRGISLTELSPFVDVASTEKRKRTTFFHAAVDVELHPIFLSQFKLILTKMAAIQTQMNSRFDNVDEKLQQLTARINQLERYGGISK
ncbi:hypothetical protein PHMEG_0005481 [Phytophthora megakarya]|uniref:Uncharacterized protein n=1 Tax=Phytophthora megakarya TaxID=4795 RepID=A0A225WSW5_9STRA|nr:hypothetical protein PHMEG_0005481 [Phytophthora megakarya]